MITLIARTDPTLPCTKLLAQQEWRVLCMIIKRNSVLLAMSKPIWPAALTKTRAGKQLCTSPQMKAVTYNNLVQTAAHRGEMVSLNVDVIFGVK